MEQLTTKRFLLLLTALAFFAVFFELGLRDVVEDNEGQRATPPAEMLRSGNYVIPTLNGKDYLAKPPLIYWAIAAVYKITGRVAPLYARIPAAAGLVLLALSVYLCGRKSLGEMPSRIAALALISSPYILDRARYAELDVPLTLATFLSIRSMASAMRATELGKTVAYAGLAGIALGAAILLKGPVPFLFLACAFVAVLVVHGGNSDAWIRAAVPWTLAAFALGAALWLLAMAAPAVARHIRFPLALAVLLGAWFYFAWRFGARRGRSLAVLTAVAAIGIAVAAPWAWAVVARKGWPYVMALLQSESLERTHSATSINSGSPFYYVLGLLAMTAPWGLALPAQASRETWRQSALPYRFHAMTGWLSVLLFSLIAGKEYEYVLPATPFLMLAMGCQLSTADSLHDWSGRWLAVWRKYVPPLLAVVAVAFLVAAITLNQWHRLHAEAFLLTAVVLMMAWLAIRQRTQAYHLIAIAAVCAILVWSLSQTYRYTGARSPKVIAEITRMVLEQNLPIEAAKMTTAFDVFPGFAFHAGCYIPTTTDPDHILEKLNGPDPYYCVVTEKMLKMYPQIPPQFTKPLVGPFTKKNLIIIGNRPLPGLRR